MKSLRLRNASAVLLSHLNRLLSVMLSTALLAGVTALGQTTTATLSGVVQDSSGSVLPSVRISARNTGTRATRETTTSDATSSTSSSCQPLWLLAGKTSAAEPSRNPIQVWDKRPRLA